MIKIETGINNIKSSLRKTKSVVTYSKTKPMESDVFLSKDKNMQSQSMVGKIKHFLGIEEKLFPEFFADKTFKSSNYYVQTPNSINLSKLYLKENYIPTRFQIVDGFRDGGRYSIISENGDITNSSREVITVDRANDIYLKNAIRYSKDKTKDLSDNKKMKVLFNMINDIGGDPEKGLELSDFIAENASGNEILLGKMFECGATCCRHKALMFKILGDEVGLQTRMVRGNLKDLLFGSYGHVWNEVFIGDNRFMVDVENKKIINVDSNNIFKRMSLRDYTDINNKEIY